MAGKAIGWGIIGASSWSDHTFGPAVAKTKGARLVAVFSSKAAHAHAYCEKHRVPNGYTDLKAFLADPALDVVWVAGPTHLHKSHAIAALKAGKHVLCEKPMAVTVADCQAMVRATKGRGLRFGLGYNNRFNPYYQALAQDWKKGAYGKPVYARVHCYIASPDTKIGWRADPKRSGGWALGNVGTHLIDLLRWFMGDAAEVVGHLSNKTWGLKVDDHALVTIGFEGGAAGTASASMGPAGGKNRLELYGTKAYAIFDGTLFGQAGTLTIGGKGRTEKTTRIPALNTYARQVEAFSAAVRTRGSFTPDAIDGLENLKIMAAARRW